MTTPRIAIVGAGPAALTAARKLARRGLQPLVLEASGAVGGLARTERYRGYRFDIGGHRFFTRGGMHRYNNQDHSMLTGLAAATNLVGGSEDPWLVNGDDEYLEMAELEPGVRS